MSAPQITAVVASAVPICAAAARIGASTGIYALTLRAAGAFQLHSATDAQIAQCRSVPDTDCTGGWGPCDAGEPWLTAAALPMGNPYCRCRLTRVRSRCSLRQGVRGRHCAEWIRGGVRQRGRRGWRVCQRRGRLSFPRWENVSTRLLLLLERVIFVGHVGLKRLMENIEEDPTKVH